MKIMIETNELIKTLIKEGKPVRINLACGQVKMEGFVGIDKVKTDVTDILFDLETYPWPIPDNCVDELTCSHFIEHVSNLPSFMDEIYRIMKSPYVSKEGEKVNSKVTIICPYYSSMRAMQDPFHIRPISEASMLYYNKDWRDVNKLDHYGIKCNFDFSYGYQLVPEWANRSQEARDFAIKHYLNVITDIYFTLTKK
jgi:hypothetical protein